MAGCSSSSDDDVQPTNVQSTDIPVSQIRLTLADVGYQEDDSIYPPQSRSESYNPGNQAVSAYWTEGDSIGIFPEGGYQIPFSVPIPDGSVREKNVIITAQGWATKTGILYAVYHPFNYEYRNGRKIPYDLRFIQHQKSNFNQENLGKYWIEGGDTVTMKEGQTVFNTTLTLMSAIVLIKCYVPATANYIRAMVVSPDKDFATHGYFDLFDVSATMVSGTKPVPYLHQPFIAEGTTDHITLDFDECQMTQGEQMYAYFVEAECNFGGKTITFYLWDDQGNIWSQQKSLPAAALGRRNNTLALNFTGTWTKVSTVDVQLNDWEKEELCPTCTPVAW